MGLVVTHTVRSQQSHLFTSITGETMSGARVGGGAGGVAGCREEAREPAGTTTTSST